MNVFCTHPRSRPDEFEQTWRTAAWQVARSEFELNPSAARLAAGIDSILLANLQLVTIRLPLGFMALRIAELQSVEEIRSVLL